MEFHRKFYRPQDIAEEFNISISTVYRWEKNGNLPPLNKPGPGTSGLFEDQIVDVKKRLRAEAGSSGASN